MRSRRFLVKSIYIGVIRWSRLDNKFIDNILLERLRKTHIVKKKIAHQCFSDDVIINSESKAGRWKDLCVPESNM